MMLYFLTVRTKFFILFLLLSLPAHAELEYKKGSSTGLPLPRFVSLKSSEVNSRAGPGTNYPIKWVYIQKHLPVEVVAEFGNWRKVRDREKDEGWVLHSLLSGKRSAILKEPATAYTSYGGKRSVMRLGKGVVIVVSKCRKTQCKFSHNEKEGWVNKAKLWGIDFHEEFD